MIHDYMHAKQKCTEPKAKAKFGSSILGKNRGENIFFISKTYPKEKNWDHSKTNQLKNDTCKVKKGSSYTNLMDKKGITVQ
jgi:hypothetical protein